MLQLGQLDLQLAFPRAGALGENIENEGSAIEDFAIKDLLQISALRRRKLVVENDGINVSAPAMLGKLIGLAFADERAGAGGSHFLGAVAHDFCTGSGGQFGKFLQGITDLPRLPRFQFNSYQENSFGASVPCLDQCFQFGVYLGL